MIATLARLYEFTMLNADILARLGQVAGTVLVAWLIAQVRWSEVLG